MIELLSIDLSNYCSKQCPFCYNHSQKEGNTMWLPNEVIAFASDCIANGVKAVSLGGGEPFEYDGIFEVIDALYPICYLSVTSNGLPLMKKELWCELLKHPLDKLHLTIHHPDNEKEVNRVEQQLLQIAESKIKPGLNLLVGADKIEAAAAVYQRMRRLLDNDQIIVLPQRFSNTPTPKQLARVANNNKFQGPSCLLGCSRSKIFCSVSWDKKVNSCSYAPCKLPLSELSFSGMIEALNRIEWKSCH